MTQELIFNQHSSDIIPSSELPAAAFVSIADPYVMIRMTDGSVQLLVGGTMIL
jgi:cleavage and polyadenylation specificity factor subunit 1